MARYDEIGRGYAEHRRPDPRLAAAIWNALGDARSVINVGAGTAAYEPPDRDVLAVEPSAVMIRQRPAGSARVVQAQAEQLPVEDGAFDAALAVLTVQHWADVDRGLSELVRVARRRVVVVTLDVDTLGELWLVRDYVPELFASHAAVFPPIEALVRRLPRASVITLPLPRDCTDQFLAALWARPEAYLDGRIRAATSAWSELPADVVDRALARLREDLDSGRWDERYGALRETEAIDVGLRIVRAELRSDLAVTSRRPLNARV